MKRADRRCRHTPAIDEAHFQKTKSFKLVQRPQKIGFSTIGQAGKFRNRLRPGVPNDAQ